MPLSYDIVDQAPQVRIVGDGVMTMPGMIAVIAQVAADARFQSNFTVTFDLRKARYTAELADGEALAAVLRQKKTDFQNRFAVVVPESLQLLAKLYCLLAAVGGFEPIQCFTDMGKAEAWCREGR
jgi:hypothetical protein